LQLKLDNIKKEHNLAKAVKSDDAEVPVHLWNEKVFFGPPTPDQSGTAPFLHSRLIRHYRRWLLKDCMLYLRTLHGKSWYDKKTKARGKGFDRDVEAVHGIVWRSTENNWFEFPMGSRLKFFRFPQKYQTMARDGVPIFFMGPKPTSKRAQATNMNPDKKAILKDKLGNIVHKKYLAVLDEELASLIKYFGVPKGVIDGVIQDWRIVYHAGANGLND